MFVETKEEARDFFLEVRQKMLKSEILTSLESIVAEVIKRHPEYHDILDSVIMGSRSLDELVTSNNVRNPFLHMGLHIALIEQLQTDRPKGIRDAYSKVVRNLDANELDGTHRAEHQILKCLSDTLQVATSRGHAPDENTYLESVEKLIPEE